MYKKDNYELNDSICKLCDNVFDSIQKVTDGTIKFYKIRYNNLLLELNMLKKLI